MSCQFRILDDNYVFKGDIQLTGSSEDPLFPASNIQKHTRSKTWRSTGFFRVTSANNKIDFKEANLGPELTATIAPGNYSITNLEAEIENQMNAVGASNYTVDYSAQTGLWTITSDGAYFDLLFATGTNIANTFRGVIGFNAVDETGALAYEGGLIAIHTEEFVLFDLAVTSPVDSFAMFFDPMSGIKFSDSAVIRLQASQTNVWTAPPVDIALTIDSRYLACSHFFSTTQNYRYWRLKIVDPQNPYLYVEVSKVSLALATLMGQGPEIGFKSSVDDLSKKSTTPYGNDYFDVYPMRKRMEFTFAFLDNTNVSELERIYLQMGNVIPFVVSLDSQEDLFDKDRFLIYGRIPDRFNPTHKFTNNFDVPLQIEEAM